MWKQKAMSNNGVSGWAIMISVGEELIRISLRLATNIGYGNLNMYSIRLRRCKGNRVCGGWSGASREQGTGEIIILYGNN